MRTTITSVVFISIALLTACKDKGKDKDKDKAAGGGTSAPGASKAAPAPAAATPAAPIELTDTVDMGTAITDPDENIYKGFKVKAPKGATVEAGLTGVQVKVNLPVPDDVAKRHGAGIGEKSYELSKAYDAGYVAEMKGKAQADEVDKLVKFHLDTPTAIIWEAKSVLEDDASFAYTFNFAAEVKVGDTTFKCTSQGYGQCSKAEAEALLKSCQSLAK